MFYSLLLQICFECHILSTIVALNPLQFRAQLLLEPNMMLHEMLEDIALPNYWNNLNVSS